MLVTCKSFDCQILPTGLLQLQLDEAKIDREDRLMTRAEVAAYLRKHPRTVTRYATRKRYPLPSVLGGDGDRRFRREDVDTWLLGKPARKRKSRSNDDLPASLRMPPVTGPSN